MAFDLAVLRSHLDVKFPRFVFYDGAFESLDDRKKENLLAILHEYADLGIQSVITLIDSDLPKRGEKDPPVFDSSEIILTLHDPYSFSKGERLIGRTTSKCEDAKSTVSAIKSDSVYCCQLCLPSNPLPSTPCFRSANNSSLSWLKWAICAPARWCRVSASAVSLPATARRRVPRDTAHRFPSLTRLTARRSPT